MQVVGMPATRPGMCFIVALENGVVVGEAVEAEAMQTTDALDRKGC